MKKREIPEIDGVSYNVESVLGEGGTAEVLLVRSSVDGQVYALKRIQKNVGSSDRDERFRNEITFGMAARNDHVVRIHAWFEDAKYFYYTMDLYPKTLREIIAGEFDYEVLLDYLSQLCDGLAYVHGLGIVHRDIKPENILVDSENRRLVLADFGIAHFKDSSLTKKGDVLANRNYQAPEQMARKDAGSITEKADIFALGVIIMEVFTKQNSRGARHRQVRDIHPFLSELDLLVERMLLQDETQRLGIEAVRDSIRLIRRQVGSRIEEIKDELRRTGTSMSGHASEAHMIFERAGKDVLSAKYIFERTTDEELSRFNLNYHCEISYRANTELYNACVQSELYSLCKAKFEYEASGSWNDSDQHLVVSPRKAPLLREFESIQRRHPLPRNSIWSGLPRMAAHYFRFCKDYHCEELMQSVLEMVSDPAISRVGSLQSDLVNAPIIWIARSVRKYLATDFFEMTPRNLQRIKFERSVSVHWEGTSFNDPSRTAVGANLFDFSHDAESIAHVLEEFEKRWDVSLGERVDGSYAIHFQSRDEYLRFQDEALAVAAPHYAFEGDVLDLLRTEAVYDDLVAIVWEPTFDIRITLAKLLGLREIT